MFRDKKSIFERLTSIVNGPQDTDELGGREQTKNVPVSGENEGWMEEETSEGQLTVDVFQNPTEIIIQTMVAGVRPDDLEISINREMVTIKGKRERSKIISEENYFFQELYWGAFSRTVVLPEEIDVEEAEALEQNGLLTIRLPKIDKKKTQKLKVKAS